MLAADSKIVRAVVPSKHRRSTRLALLAAILAATLALVAASAPTAQAGLFGVGLHPSSNAPSADEFQKMRRGNVGAVRVELNWAAIQRLEGDCLATTSATCDWTATDNYIGRAADSGIPVLPFFYGTPHFARGGREVAEPPLGTPEHRAAWKDFVSAAAERYGPGGVFWQYRQAIGERSMPITTWQIWNEQNSESKWLPRSSAAQYAQLIKLSDAALTSVNPRARQMLGGMFGTPHPDSRRSYTAWAFLNRLYQIKGAKRSFDFVAAHPYSPNLYGLKYQVNKLRQVMAKRRDAKIKLAITEIGWSSANSNHPYDKGVKGQARMLRQAFPVFRNQRRKWKLDKVYWFSWSDVGDRCDPRCGQWDTTSGLFTAQTPPQAKPAWGAYMRQARGRR